MEKRLLLVLVVLSAVMVAPTPQHGSAMAELLQSDGFIVPSLVFTTVVTSTITVASEAVSLVSNLTAAVGDFRLSNALSDCVDLLALSSDQLSWTLSAAQTGESNGTGRIISEMKTWLSAALVNQDTCVDGFEGTNSLLKEQIAGSLSQVTSLVLKAINMLPETPRPEKSNNGGSKGGGRKLLMGGGDESFPSWVSPKDRELLQTAGVRTADVVVAADGTGNFTTVTDAVAAAPDYSTRRFVIYIRRGVYKENVEIKRWKSNIMVFGDGMDATIITGSRSYLDGWTTYRTATFGSGFIARDLTIENTAGPQKLQAVAFRSDSDLSALYRCAFRGYQDTLYTHTNRQFYRECTITGTVDFMFGNAVAVFQSCQILARKGLPNQKNTVTAQGRKEQEDVSGFSVQFCNITADSDLLQGPANFTYTYLGRPWKQYSRTIFMQSYIGALVRPEGWLEWSEGMFLDTLFYAEYMNFGPGAAVGSRVQWPGYHVFNGSDQAIKFTVAEFIDGNSWLPQTGVTFSAGLEA